MRFHLLPMILLITSACATTASSSTSIAYRMIDHPDEQRLELRYKNETDRTMCLLPEFWPNGRGTGGFVSVGSERFAIEDVDTGYCPQGCARRVAPGEEIAGSIPYSDFNLPDRLWQEPKALEFQPQAYVCK
jgi:hypothetical protein